MATIGYVEIDPLQPERFQEILEEEDYASFGQVVLLAKEMLAGRAVLNVNSTSRGGGVAEMLASLLAYARGGDIDARWAVIEGNPDFFAITKRIHNNLHGAPGDGGPLGDAEHRIYEEALSTNAEGLVKAVKPKDVVLLHDPQTAGLTASLKDTGATVIWRCHVGLDTPNETARRAWRFLRGYVTPADAYIFSRPAFAWDGLDEDRIVVIPPSIDAFSPKNQDLSLDEVKAILATTEMFETDATADPLYVRVDGRPDVVERKTEMYGAPPPPFDVPVVVQVSRWDRLKDPLGVMESFTRYVAPNADAHLMLAGPAVAAVADDPEGKEVLEEAHGAWKLLEEDVRSRVHLACMPMDDGQENAAIVNALQRRADVIVQKSLAEGFGLTVAEGMWKARPVVASRIGGIQDQIQHGETGILLDDPYDLETFGKELVKLLEDPQGAERMGEAARLKVRDHFLGARHLTQYFDLIARLLNS
jgi:trehalose synthase